jgi:hypothetical protein
MGLDEIVNGSQANFSVALITPRTSVFDSLQLSPHPKSLTRAKLSAVVSDDSRLPGLVGHERIHEAPAVVE